MVNNQEQLKFVVIYLFILLTYIRFINTGHFMEIRLSWFSVLYGLSCIIGKLGLYFVLHHTIRVSSLLEYEWYSRQLQEQLERQIQHYHRITSYNVCYTKLLRYQTAVVTGGKSGIGRGIVQILLQSGARVISADLAYEENYKGVDGQLFESRLDLSKSEDISRWSQLVLEQAGVV